MQLGQLLCAIPAKANLRACFEPISAVHGLRPVVTLVASGQQYQRGLQGKWLPLVRVPLQPHLTLAR